jgi:hypothetical protein
MQIKGSVLKVLVIEAADIASEAYAGIISTVRRASRCSW